MHSVNVSPRHRARGSLTIWTIIVIAALGCVVAVLVLQVMEYLFYDQPRSVWPGAGPGGAPQAMIQPPAENVIETDVTLEEVSAGPGADPDLAESRDVTGKEANVSELPSASEIKEPESEPKTEATPVDEIKEPEGEPKTEATPVHEEGSAGKED